MIRLLVKGELKLNPGPQLLRWVRQIPRRKGRYAGPLNLSTLTRIQHVWPRHGPPLRVQQLHLFGLPVEVLA